VIDEGSSLLFVSGQVDWDRQHQISQSTVAGQFEAALGNLKEVLHAAGSSVDQILHLRVFVRGELEDHMPALGPILSAFLGSSRAAITGVGVSSLATKATLVEVEAIAKV
jgi:enamine deaminase RidA (YjgF/YER057c/UK114 family)